MEVVQVLSVTNQNPDYIFIQFNFHNASIANEYLTETTITSKVFIIFSSDMDMTNPTQKIFVLCFPCEKTKAFEITELLHNDTTTELQILVLNTTFLDTIWQKVNHADLQNTFILQGPEEVAPIGKINPNWCSATFGRFLLSKASCVSFVISRKHNFSYLLERGKTIPNTRIIAGLPFHGEVADKELIDSIISSRYRNPYQYVVYTEALWQLPFTYVIVSESARMNDMYSLVMPFDKFIWMANISSLFLVVITFTTLTNGSVNVKKNKVFKNITSKLFWTLRSLFAQPSTNVKREFDNLFKFSPWIVSWYFVAFILGITYQGSLSSCLTAQILPNVPKTLEELVASTIPIITTTAGGIGDKRISVLKETINDIKIYHKNGDDPFLNSILRLYNSTIFVDGDGINISYNISTRKSIGAGESATFVLKSGLFAVMDLGKELETLLEGLSLLLPSLVVIRNHEMAKFIIRVPWYGHRNFLYPLFSRGLGQLEQSGIYERWQVLQDIKERLKTSKRAVSREQYRAMLVKSVTKVRAEVKFAEADPVSVEVLKYVFILCVSLSGGGLVAFFSEIVPKSWLNWRLTSLSRDKHKFYVKKNHIIVW
ncbi:Glutamate receptor 3.7 [Folsomia candida]|uniref:Glutamate receptor 3.7 n=1 Tax=Folsomia candida TaxID=158441 RepID=A0A226DIY2_FOLCA|nr:Glutamate receptor 3.7 [Folsomia candida]